MNEPDPEIINFEEIKESVRFFPKWTSHDTNQVEGLINLIFYMYKKNPNIASLLEVGVNIGEATNIFLGFPFITKMHCIDDFKNKETKRFFLKRIANYFLKKRLLILNRPMNEIYSAVKDKKFDIVYIDIPELLTDASNLDLFKNLVNLNGFLCGHDYNPTEWLSVRKAIDTFIDNNKDSYKDLKYFTDTSWCIQKIKE
jgi:hypothetical protein